MFSFVLSRLGNSRRIRGILGWVMGIECSPIWNINNLVVASGAVWWGVEARGVVIGPLMDRG